MNTSSQKVIGGIVVVVVVVAAIVAFTQKGPSTTPAPTNEASTNGAMTDEPTNGEAMDAGTNTAGSVKPGSGTSAPTRLSYADALRKYQYRFFFAANCVATAATGTVGSVNIKQKTPIMISNTDTKSHKIGVGETTLNVAPGDYQVVTLPASSKETTGLYVTCDGKGTGRIYVQP